MAPDPAEELSLWRYHLIAEALDRRIGSKERGLIVRRLAGEEHVGPDGQPHAVSRNTLDRWIRAYRQHGLAGLRDRPRSDQGGVRRHAALIQEAVQLRLEQPARSAAHIAEILSAHRVRVAERTLREQFQKRGLTRAELLRDQRAFGRYEAAEPNERWIADVLVGPWVPPSEGARQPEGEALPDCRRPQPAAGPRPLGQQRDPARWPGGAPRRHPPPRPAQPALC